MTTEAPSVSDSAPAPASTPSLLNDPVVGEYIRFDPDIDWNRFWEQIDYEWLLDGQPNPEMSGSTSYQVRAEDFGHRLSARVTLKEYGADPVTYTTAESEPVLGSIGGSLQYPAEPILGTTLSAIASVTNAPAFSAGSESAFTWSRNGTPIPEAESESYTVTEADLGAELTCTMVVSAPGYRPWSESTSYGIGFRGYLDLAAAPAITWSGNSTDTAPVGTALRASTPPVTGTAPAGLGYTYQWFERTFSEQIIPGATGATYVPTAKNIGNRIGVRVTPTAPNYRGRTRSTGFYEGPSVEGAFTGVTAPTIKGTAAAGQVLTAVAGVAPTPAADLVQYEWYRGSTRLTSWDTTPTYTLTKADGGFKITVRARYFRAHYAAATTALSAPVTPPGYFTVGHPPVIRGTAAVGHTVTADTWPDMTSPKPSQSACQWLRDGKPITGATGLSYRLTAADQWRQITFRQTHTRAGYVPGTLTSLAIKPVAVFARLANPVITGTTKVGYTLRATAATPSPTPTSTSWQWMRNDKPIAGATASSYKLTRYDRNAYIKVKVTFRKSAYLDTARHSASRWLP
ncbi:hypothetical protein [Arthrobacter pityocampae]|uniref:hypothetical protein n=1 Tax=Arthrobacter pityocampae TaxID=547334 RepID=UPI003735D148